MLCFWFYEKWKPPCVARVNLVESCPQQIWPWPCDLDLWPLTLTLATFNLDLCDLDFDLGPPFLILGWKLEFYIFDLGDLNLWPTTLTFEYVRDMMVFNVCAKVRRSISWAFRAQTDTHTQMLPKILPLPLKREVKSCTWYFLNGIWGCILISSQRPVTMVDIPEYSWYNF